MAQPARAPAVAPVIELGDFQLTVHGRQFPDAQDRWDGNWLQVSARCAQAGAIVAATGPMLEASDLQRFRDQLAGLPASPGAEAVLAGAEPNLVVRVSFADALGLAGVRVELTPEPGSQGHWFTFAVDPSYLAEAIRQLDAVLAAFPVRGRAPSLADLDRADD
jgi:acetyl esterase/lipase